MSGTEERLREMESELSRLRARMRVLVDGSPLGIFFDDADDTCVFVNTTFCEMMELSESEALGDGWARSVHPDDLDRLLGERARAVAQGTPLFRAEYRYICPSGRSGWVEEQTRPVHGPDGSLLGYVGTLAEITGRKAEEAMLARHSEELEIRVRERTAELEAQAGRLAAMNAALEVLLRKREEDRADLERAVLANARRRILPALDRLEGLCRGDVRPLIGEIRQGLDELTDPFRHHLSAAGLGLTPSETRVAEFIRQGLSTKEIAARLGVGTSTIDTHRHGIRRKLGLHSRQESLRARLLTLDAP
jgi:PAS domain S-box-containing protein